QTSLRGGELTVPFYWNIAPEQDATITPTFSSKRGEQLKTRYRYLGRRFSGEARVEYLPEDKLLGLSRTGDSVQHEQRFTPALTAKVDMNHVSDDTYFVDLYSDVRQVSTGNLQRDGYLQYARELSGIGMRLLNLEGPRNDMGGRLDAALPVEYARFTHPTLVEGERSTVNPVLSAPLTAPGYFLTPRLGARHARYALSRTATGQPERQTLSVPWFSLDGGLVFERGADWFGEGLTQTLEPRLFYVYAPYRDQSQLPLFDTALADLNYAPLFSQNRFAGGARFG